MTIEYRLERSWGIGLPGDNETGFVVYRLTDQSAARARKQGSHLGDLLSGKKGAWRSTPIDNRSDQLARSRWHPYDDEIKSTAAGMSQDHLPTVLEYLDKCGFSIPIEEGQDAEANEAIQSPGSLYSYGKGGSVTIVDPGRGKVYFAYAG